MGFFVFACDGLNARAGFPLLTGIRGSAGVSRGPTEAITGPPRYISGVQPVMPGVQFGPLDPCRENPAGSSIDRFYGGFFLNGSVDR